MPSHTRDTTASPFDRRATPRYRVDTRIFASIDGRTVALHNIGNSGVAFRAGGLRAGTIHMLEINLDRRHVTLGIEILEESEDRLLHARFVDGEQETMDAIAQYVDALAEAL